MDGQRSVVVGVDGSPEARVAARLGAQEALHRGLPLELVLVLPGREPRSRPGGGGSLAAMVHSAAVLVLEATAAHAVHYAPGLSVTTRVLSGRPADVLVAASASADLLCVGSRGSGTLGELVLGSVASALVRSARCPVLVVPLRHLAAVRGRRSVVVGIKGSPGSGSLARIALAEAAARGTDLLAVHAWHHPYPGRAHVVLDPLIDPVAAQRREQELLDDVLDAALTAAEAIGSPVPVRRVVERARAADALVAASLTAELLVVGSRRRDGSSALSRLGSVTHAVLHSAGCPVLVVPLSLSPTAQPPLTSAAARP